MNLHSFFFFSAALILAPLLIGVINRTKAFFGGRHGRPLLQLYYDLAKLLRKGAVYSRTTTWVFRAGPVVGLASVGTAILLLPLGGAGALVSFPGDLVLLAYLLGTMRFFTVIAALDTGSAFEGMGASREVQFSALAEPAFFLGLAVLAQVGGSIAAGKLLSLSEMMNRLTVDVWMKAGPALLLAAGALLVVFLTENARIPIDDPNTHLELTMIHEVMVLDHGGPDFAMILYGAALKMWIFAGLIAGLLVPARSANPWIDGAASIAGIFLLAVVTGIIESIMARLRLLRVPQLLVGAGLLATIALVLVLRN